MTSELIALRAMFGQDEANHGVTRYRVDGEGLVWVPPQAAGFLISKGGFALAKTRAATAVSAAPVVAQAEPLVRLRHRDAAGCSYAGFSYPSDENGDVLVPAEAVAELMAHGFVVVPQRRSGGCANSAAEPATPASAARRQVLPPEAKG